MKEYRFKDFNIIGDGFRAEIRLSSLNPLFKRAQYYLSEQYLQACRARMPLRTGSLQQLSHTEDEGRKIVFPGPYARFLYYGKVMVDPGTGSPWAREGAQKVVTERDLTFSNPAATAHWAEVAWAQDGKAIMAGVNKIMRGG